MTNATPSIYEIPVSDINKVSTTLAPYKGKVLLIVNVASRCGFTPQYKELEVLQETYSDQGFEVLAFPCNQFGNQEPGNEAEILSFCQTNYKTSFPIFSKVLVNGTETSPLYKFLKEAQPGLLGVEAIKWNFTKFLVNREGQVVERFAPLVSPLKITKKIEALLAQS
jgi:glutathione peroxidase